MPVRRTDRANQRGTRTETAPPLDGAARTEDPDDVAKMLVALWVGIRRISDLDQPEHYLDNLQKAWIPSSTPASPAATASGHWPDGKDRQRPLIGTRLLPKPILAGRTTTLSTNQV